MFGNGKKVKKERESYLLLKILTNFHQQVLGKVAEI